MQEEETFVTVRLSAGTSTTDLASACRNAWRSFAANSLGWGRAEVASWTVRSYQPILRYVSQRAIPDDDLTGIDPRLFTRIVRTARSKLVETLWSFNDPDARVQFARDSYSAGLVIRCHDASQRLGFAPAPGQRTLSARVISLVGADLLTRSIDFAQGALCGDCGQVKLDPKPCCFVSELRRVGS